MRRAGSNRCRLHHRRRQKRSRQGRSQRGRRKKTTTTTKKKKMTKKMKKSWSSNYSSGSFSTFNEKPKTALSAFSLDDQIALAKALVQHHSSRLASHRQEVPSSVLGSEFLLDHFEHARQSVCLYLSNSSFGLFSQMASETKPDRI